MFLFPRPTQRVAMIATCGAVFFSLVSCGGSGSNGSGPFPYVLPMGTKIVWTLKGVDTVNGIPLQPGQQVPNWIGATLAIETYSSTLAKGGVQGTETESTYMWKTDSTTFDLSLTWFGGTLSLSHGKKTGSINQTSMYVAIPNWTYVQGPDTFTGSNIVGNFYLSPDNTSNQ